ncbi:hypothetical protein BDQ17DRAFT_1027254 [Cyathus striatus]|nr:hypothetical protein BDQ17DRAFT_1027254 [Cyathus striatus]
MTCPALLLTAPAMLCTYLYLTSNPFHSITTTPPPTRSNPPAPLPTGSDIFKHAGPGLYLITSKISVMISI